MSQRESQLYYLVYARRLRVGRCARAPVAITRRCCWRPAAGLVDFCHVMSSWAPLLGAASTANGPFGGRKQLEECVSVLLLYGAVSADKTHLLHR